MKMKWVGILFFTLVFSGLELGQANPLPITIAIDNFVANLVPKANHYFWIINDTTNPTQNEMIVDVNTIITKKAGDEPNKGRFLLLLVNGQLQGAQQISLEADVGCGDEVV